jgi:hypothetical protein
MHDSGALRGEIANVYLELERRHCEERSDEASILSLRFYGLLRLARNDGLQLNHLRLFEK